MNEKKLRDRLAGRAAGHALCCLVETDSTNLQAKARGLRGGDWIVTADTQTAGRGRLGRSFAAEPGGLYLSLTCRPRLPAKDAACLTALTGLAVSEAIHTVTGVRPEIKWPNDLLLGGRKLCGILVEAVHSGGAYFIVAGIGVNLTNPLPPELQKTAVRLAEFTAPPEPERLAAEVAAGCLEVCARAAVERPALMRQYAARCVTLGRRVCAVSDGQRIEGEAVDVDGSGALLVRLDSGETVPIFYGEATLRAEI
jgi:BirA family biotin operon repressor/biotin-[acetyl-CoA-carboxylase] ligase